MPAYLSQTTLLMAALNQAEIHFPSMKPKAVKDLFLQYSLCHRTQDASWYFTLSLHI